MTPTIVDRLRVPKKLTLAFFGAFSRFEYALKRAKYVKGQGAHVLPDWIRFGKDLSGLGAATLAPVLEACPYLQANPPKRQVLRDGELDWDDLLGNKSQIENVLLYVRTVRNNLFHGGKFPRTGSVEEPLRNKKLITECLAVLDCLLKLPLPNDVKDYFWNDV
jgi:hypothetical protein